MIAERDIYHTHYWTRDSVIGVLKYNQVLFSVLQVTMVATDKWLEVGLALGFKMVDLNGYEEQEPKRLHRRLLHLLVDWKDKVENSTVGGLVSACKEAGVIDAVKRELIEH